MVGNLKEEIKVETIVIEKEITDKIFPSSTVQDTSTVQDKCTVFIEEEDIKFELTDPQGKIKFF